MGNPHILVVPYPAQGHVIPLMELSQNLAKQGFRISFVNTEFNHKRIMDAFGKNVDENDLVHLVSLPDGLEEGEDRNQIGKLIETLYQVMPRTLKEFIDKVNRSEDDKITCVLADANMGLALDVAAELGIRRAAVWPASVFQLVSCLSIPKLIDDGLIDENGTPVNEHKMFQLSPTSPAIHPTKFAWLNFDDSTTRKIVFHLWKRNNKAVETADWVLCNSSLDLEPGGFNLVPKVLPIGPLSASNRLGNLSGNFWPEDTTCLQWLDQQPPGSVIYIAFGSFTVFDQIQFQELALGLELSNRPFLWVVRPDIAKGKQGVYFPEGFQERVASQGMMVGWAPQGAVLSHPSIACFLSHCGWNSTIEGVSNGVPFLCWPYFADQFLNESYISDIWKVGLKFERDERGIISKEEIKTKVEQLLGDKNFKRRAVQLKEMVANSVKEGGSSDRIFKNFIEWMKS
ncbi:UDP-glycosyltransferase 83A1-like [Durio zibethinus]|uniref:UDP-glycosyltransferase 83A1-like n=1 Tax=Durio zibethinus TaxID=66656 RepID=A0A6P6B992_DURZI|nr:UDP-glycosyltransferase 83A1-like [Durio zibethinus]